MNPIVVLVIVFLIISIPGYFLKLNSNQHLKDERLKSDISLAFKRIKEVVKRCDTIENTKNNLSETYENRIENIEYKLDKIELLSDALHNLQNTELPDLGERINKLDILNTEFKEAAQKELGELKIELTNFVEFVRKEINRVIKEYGVKISSELIETVTELQEKVEKNIQSSCEKEVDKLIRKIFKNIWYGLKDEKGEQKQEILIDENKSILKAGDVGTVYYDPYSYQDKTKGDNYDSK